MSLNWFLCLSYFGISLIVLTTSESTNTTNYNESLDIWNQVKLTNGDCYTYTTSFTSFVGYGFSTTIKISDGIVIERSYESFQWNYDTNEKIIQDTYEENSADDIGSNSNGAPTKTIDELYSECPQYINVDEYDHYIYFTTDENGIIKMCGNVPKDCADDCYDGIEIDDLLFCNEDSNSSTVYCNNNNDNSVSCEQE
eukprot:710115_1